MKATLIIKNIENLYTCDKDFTVLSHCFIALHHDKIIDISTGSFTQWLDPATAVIDARGECVVPGFIGDENEWNLNFMHRSIPPAKT